MGFLGDDPHQLLVPGIAVEDVVRSLQKEESVGKQIVIGFVYKDEKPHNDTWANLFKIYQDAIAGMQKGEFDTDRFYAAINIGTMWVLESVLE